MQAKMLRSEEITHPDLKSQADVVALRAQLDSGEITPQEWRARMFLRVPPGTVIDHPHAHQLVAMGMAEPHDKECHARCQRAGLNVTVLAEAQDRVREARLTGDPAFDRAASPEPAEVDDAEPSAELTDADAQPQPKIIVGSDALVAPVEAP